MLEKYNLWQSYFDTIMYLGTIEHHLFLIESIFAQERCVLYILLFEFTDFKINSLSIKGRNVPKLVL